MKSKFIDITPKASILKILRFLDYKMWYALAEYVDNSIQSYNANAVRLKKVDGENYTLNIDIQFDYENRSIKISDNAAGIEFGSFERAFRAAEVPDDTSGLSEFGMGMKSASYWFAPKWSVRTTSLGDNIERIVKFDSKNLDTESGRIKIGEKEVKSNNHYTIIELTNVHRMPKGGQANKIKDHLTSIYRTFLRNGDVQIFIDDPMHKEPLEYEEVKILNAPFCTEEGVFGDGPSQEWKEEFEFDLNENGSKRVKGFIGIRETGTTLGKNGLAIMRRGRVIEGSDEDAYRPSQIYGTGNSYAMQRLFGEITVEGYDVSFQKNRIDWGDTLEEFFQIMDEFLKEGSPKGNFYDQVNFYRALKRKKDRKKLADGAGKKIKGIGKGIQKGLDEITDGNPIEEPILEPTPNIIELMGEEPLKFPLYFRGEEWVGYLKFSDNDHNEDAFFIVNDNYVPTEDRSENENQIGIWVNSDHKFFTSIDYTQRDLTNIGKIIVSLGIAEKTTKTVSEEMSPDEFSEILNKNVNIILKNI